MRDVRYSLRALAKRPSFACAAVLVLGLAVGVKTAVFSLIRVDLLSALGGGTGPASRQPRSRLSPVQPETSVTN